MSRAAEWELLVVGGGTAGIVAGKTAAGLGARVLLVERERTGGDCLWTGCVPSKALLASASAAADARRADRLGVRVSGVEVDFAAVMRHVHGAIARIEPVDSPAALRGSGVEVVAGDLVLTGPRSARVAGRTVTFGQAVVCTGSSPAMPALPGLDAAGPLTSETVWDLTELPGRLAVLGGGAIGCELGQAFARLGARVTVVEAADRILAKEDPDAAALVAAQLARDGVDLRTGAEVTAVQAGRDGAGALLLADGARVGFDRLVVAVGRRPRTDGLGLDAAGVALDPAGHIRVDDHLRTTNPAVWAAGDVTGRALFTHTAGADGSLAASNAVLGLRRRVDQAVPRVTYTRPEVAAVGTATGPDRPAGSTVLHRDHAHLDRAVTEDDVEGFTRLVVDGRGRVTGATVVGPRAGETLGELTLAVRRGLTAQDLAGTTHAYPTWNDAAWQAAVEHVRTQLTSGATERVVQTLAAARRGWLRSRFSAGRGSPRPSAGRR